MTWNRSFGLGELSLPFFVDDMHALRPLISSNLRQGVAPLTMNLVPCTKSCTFQVFHCTGPNESYFTSKESHKSIPKTNLVVCKTFIRLIWLLVVGCLTHITIMFN